MTAQGYRKYYESLNLVLTNWLYILSVWNNFSNYLRDAKTVDYQATFCSVFHLKLRSYQQNSSSRQYKQFWWTTPRCGFIRSESFCSFRSKTEKHADQSRSELALAFDIKICERDAATKIARSVSHPVAFTLYVRRKLDQNARISKPWWTLRICFVQKCTIDILYQCIYSVGTPRLL